MSERTDHLMQMLDDAEGRHRDDVIRDLALRLSTRLDEVSRDLIILACSVVVFAIAVTIMFVAS